MDQLTWHALPDGLFVDVLVGLDGATTTALVAAGRPHPKPSRVRGAVDTGSDITCVARPVLQGLGVPVMYHTTTHGVGGSMPVDLYYVSISITDFAAPGAPLLVQPTLLVMELP